MGPVTKNCDRNGLVEKLSDSLLDPNKIQYVPMSPNTHKSAFWGTFDKVLFWCIPLLIFLGVSSVFIIFMHKDCITQYLNGQSQLKVVSSGSSLNWDELKFTQTWGYSSCLEFKDKSSSSFTCRYENEPSFWAIHGIWPNREGSHGPNFCSKVKYDGSLLEPIRTSLEKFWYEMNSKKEGDDFWSHEWVKHGSCAKELPIFDTELKYFTAGLELHKKYDLANILKNSNIIPQKQRNATGYNVEQITQAIQTSLGQSAIPYVQCLQTQQSGSDSTDYYLLAIELCLNKDLELFSCDRDKSLATKYGDRALPCPHDKPIQYVDNDF